MKVLAATFMTALLFLALVSSLNFAEGTGPFSVSIDPLYASIDLGESVEFNSTVRGDIIPSRYQWFLNGTAFAEATSSSWEFTPSAGGIYDVYLVVYVAVDNSADNVSQTEAISQTARILAGSQALTGILGYPHTSSQAGSSGAQYDAVGSRFILNVEANVTSMSCLIDYWIDTLYPNQNYSYSFAIYGDNDGAVGNLVAQTAQGTITIDSPPSVPMWLTLSFPSVVHLAPGAYWLMEVDNSTGQVSKYNEVLDTFESVTMVIESMTFPTSLPYSPTAFSRAFCIYASWDVSFSARLREGQNVFAVASNSTVSALSYNSTASELSFTVSGSADTIGYTEVFISKDLLQEPNELTVFIDGKQTNFTSTSVDGFWALHFVYSHSTHNVAINLQSNAVPLGGPQDTIIGATVAVIVIGAGLGVLIYLLKRKEP